MLNTGSAGPQLAEVVAREGVRALLIDGEFVERARAIPRDVLRLLTWTDDGEPANITSIEELAATHP